MTENVRAHAQRVADALVVVVESARWEARIASIRDLAMRAEMTHTALNKRMRRETPFNVRDLAAIGTALGIAPNELLRRAVTIVEAEDVAIAAFASAEDPVGADDGLIEETEEEVGLESDVNPQSPRRR